MSGRRDEVCFRCGCSNVGFMGRSEAVAIASGTNPRAKLHLIYARLTKAGPCQQWYYPIVLNSA